MFSFFRLYMACIANCIYIGINPCIYTHQVPILQRKSGLLEEMQSTDTWQISDMYHACIYIKVPWKHKLLYMCFISLPHYRMSKHLYRSQILRNTNRFTFKIPCKARYGEVGTSTRAMGELSGQVVRVAVPFAVEGITPYQETWM